MLLANYILDSIFKKNKRKVNKTCSLSTMMKKQKITKQNLFLCCISCLLSIFAILYYYYYYYYTTIYLLYLEYLFYAAGKWAPKTRMKKHDPYFSTEKIISERKPPKSNPCRRGLRQSRSPTNNISLNLILHFARYQHKLF